MIHVTVNTLGPVRAWEFEIENCEHFVEETETLIFYSLGGEAYRFERRNVVCVTTKYIDDPPAGNEKGGV